VEKPAGTVWIAVSLRDQMVHTQKFLFTGDRREVRLQAVDASLRALLELVERG
jgi:nicotinamide-nucleotide amidase